MGRAFYDEVLNRHLASDSGEQDFNSAQVDLAEYSALKEEQIGRINLRDAALHINIIVSLSILGFVYTDIQSRYLVLLFLPFSSLVLFGIYYQNDAYVSRIRMYVEQVLRPSLQKMANAPDPLAWETLHRKLSVGRVFRKLLGAFMLIVAFVGPAVVGLLLVNGMESASSPAWLEYTAISATLLISIGTLALVFG